NIHTLSLHDALPIYISTSADLLKSTVRLDELFPFLMEQGTASAAIVNTKLYGILPFWEACLKAGIHGVVGLSTFIEFEEQEYPVDRKSTRLNSSHVK